MARIVIGTQNLWFGPRLDKKLTARGHRVERFGNLVNLLPIVHSKPPNLVVLDLRDHPGQIWKIYGQLSVETRNLPILLLSSADPDAVDLALRLVAEVFTEGSSPVQGPKRSNVGTENRFSALC